jgi:hypothetical protein
MMPTIFEIHFQYIVFIDIFENYVDTSYFHRVTLHRNNTIFSKNGNGMLRLLAHQPALAEKIRLHPSPKRRPGSTEVGEFLVVPAAQKVRRRYGESTARQLTY